MVIHTYLKSVFLELNDMQVAIGNLKIIRSIFYFLLALKIENWGTSCKQENSIFTK